MTTGFGAIRLVAPSEGTRGCARLTYKNPRPEKGTRVQEPPAVPPRLGRRVCRPHSWQGREQRPAALIAQATAPIPSALITAASPAKLSRMIAGLAARPANQPANRPPNKPFSSRLPGPFGTCAGARLAAMSHIQVWDDGRLSEAPLHPRWDAPRSYVLVRFTAFWLAIFGCWGEYSTDSAACQTSVVVFSISDSKSRRPSPGDPQPQLRNPGDLPVCPYSISHV
jgi:hypothetical protein